MRRASTWGVFVTIYGVVLGLAAAYAVVLSVYHRHLMYLRLWTQLLTLGLIAAPVVLLVSAVVAFALNRRARRRADDR